MTRLIVDDGGSRRAFKVGDGVLAIGSGSAATLKLTDPGVAEVHAELEIRGTTATLKTKPGVMPPTLGGETALGDVVVDHGVPIQIGGSTITLEFEGGGAAPAASSASSSAAPAAGVVKRSSARAGGGTSSKAPASPVRRGAAAGGGGAVKRGAGVQRAASRERDEDRGDEGGGQRSMAYRQRKKKDDSAQMLILVLGVPGILAIVYLLFTQVFFRADAQEYHPNLYYNDARKHLDEERIDKARTRLAQIDFNNSDTPSDLKPKVDRLLAEIDAKEKVIAEDFRNFELGNRYLERKVKSFRDNWVSGSPEMPVLKFYVRRLKYFKSEWPSHEGVEWVNTELRRFQNMVDLTVPRTYADIEFEMKMMRGAEPREWDAMVKLLDDFRRSAEGQDLDREAALRTEVLADRDAWILDKDEQARWHFDRAMKKSPPDSEELGKCVGWLVKLTVYSGVPDTADDAADKLIKVPGIEDWLRGYKKHDPVTFKRLIAHPTVNSYAQQNDIPTS